MATPEVRHCPKCGAPLRADTGEASCPACAMRGAFAEEDPNAKCEVQSSESMAKDRPPSPRPSPPLARLRQSASAASATARQRGEGEGGPHDTLGRSALYTPHSALGRRFGDYELLEEIARGGMGVVYKTRQISLNRTVAVKMILAGQFASAADVQRFRAEAEAVARLQHPNIVAIHEIGERDGQPYFSMEYVEGQNLGEVVGRTPLPPRQAAKYMQTIAEAMHYAHQHGILHRDLKPSNVLIDQNGQPRITDFGLAKRIHSDSQLSTLNSQLTQSGQVLGSPNFMPPEQASGKRGQVGPHSDIYSMGAILYYLLSARPPFVAEELTETLQQVVNEEPPSPRLLNPGVPRDLETICLKCLSKDPERRYQTAQALAEELGRFLRDEPILARPIGATGKAWRWCRRNPKLATLAGHISTPRSRVLKRFGRADAKAFSMLCFRFSMLSQGFIRAVIHP